MKCLSFRSFLGWSEPVPTHSRRKEKGNEWSGLVPSRLSLIITLPQRPDRKGRWDRCAHFSNDYRVITVEPTASFVPHSCPPFVTLSLSPGKKIIKFILLSLQNPFRRRSVVEPEERDGTASIHERKRENRWWKRSLTIRNILYEFPIFFRSSYFYSFSSSYSSSQEDRYQRKFILCLLSEP